MFTLLNVYSNFVVTFQDTTTPRVAGANASKTNQPKSTAKPKRRRQYKVNINKIIQNLIFSFITVRFEDT